MERTLLANLKYSGREVTGPYPLNEDISGILNLVGIENNFYFRKV